MEVTVRWTMNKVQSPVDAAVGTNMPTSVVGGNTQTRVRVIALHGQRARMSIVGFYQDGEDQGRKAPHVNSGLLRVRSGVRWK